MCVVIHKIEVNSVTLQGASQDVGASVSESDVPFHVRSALGLLLEVIWIILAGFSCPNLD